MSLTTNQIIEAANSAADISLSRQRLVYGANINTKHTKLYAEFGWIECPEFSDYLRLYKRNPVAHAIISKLNAGTWQSKPEVIEGEVEDADKERSANEIAADKLIKQWWGKFKDGDRRNMVGRYAGLILMLRDGQTYDQPVTTELMPESIERIIPVWEDQLEPTEWNTDEKSPEYGDVTMYHYSGFASDNMTTKPTQVIAVHPDRVIIINEGVEDYCLESGEPMMEAPINALMDWEKVLGGASEGFYKNAARQLSVNFEKETNLDDIMSAYGIKASDPEKSKLFREKFNERMNAVNRGADAAMIGKGMKTEVLSVTPADPETTNKVLAQAACASTGMPYRVVMGNETGERASTEDNKGANLVYMERQENHANAILTEFLNRMMRFGILNTFEFSFKWPDLNEPTNADKLDNFSKLMTAIKQSVEAYGEPVIKPNEAREIGGFPALDEFNQDQERPNPDNDDKLDDEEE